MALEAGVLDEIAARKGERVTAEQLAEKTGYDALLIARVMRLVSFAGICDEVGENTYAGTEMTRLIATPGLSGGEKHHYDLLFPIGAKIVEYMHKTKVHQFPKDASEPSAFEYGHGMGFWEYFNRTPEQRKYFDDYMATRRVGLQTWFETFPAAEVLVPGAKKDADAVLLVDVGGNKGHEAAAFRKAHPDAPGRCILQDLPPMIERVKKQGPPAEVECMAYDFFTRQPIKGARAYYFRNICHDWSDHDCEKFLTQTAKSMDKDYSRMLIDEYVLPDTRSPFRGSAMDLLMMLFLGGIERTRHQWETLLDRCGLEIVKVWGGRDDYERVIEARLKS